MSDLRTITYFCEALKGYLKECPELQASALQMVDIILDKNSTEDEKKMSANTLEDILFPPRGMQDIVEKMEAIPFEHRLHWCEAVGPCACMGCANGAGVTKGEWRRYGKSIGLKLSAWGNRLEGDNIKEVSATHGDVFNLRLEKVPAVEHRLGVIQAIRRITGLDLKMSRDLVYAAPKVFKTRVPREEAYQIKAEIEGYGGWVSLGR